MLVPSAGYQELDTTTVAAFAAPFLPGPAQSAAEVGDGNLNRVFRVRSADASVVVKQAVPYLKAAGEAWPLTRDRARTERDALVEHGKLAPGAVPGIIHFDEERSALVLEDLAGHQSWRELLIAGQFTPGVAAAVGEYCARVLLGTSDLLLPSRERKLLRGRFPYSELCLVTEDLVFTAPYTDAESNRYDAELAETAQSLRTDRALRMAVAELRFAFKTSDEALIHGDLHSGSVFVGQHGVRIIDLEFAFFGPFGFDPGLLLANLAMSYLAHEARGHDAFCAAVAGYAGEFWAAFADSCRRLWDPAEPWYHRFLAVTLADAARYAGLEMIRRMVGLAHVKDVDELPQPARLTAQQHIVAGGRALILGSRCTSFDELWSRAVQEENFG
jgi:5-methylthioribose kinase